VESVLIASHSCPSSCAAVRRMLQEGEELTISYIDLQLPRSARRDLLRKDFNFLCECVRCKSELVHGSAKCTFHRSVQAEGKSCAPKKRGRKARISRN
jgi:hypothetical protein